MATEKWLIDANALPKSWMLAQFTEVNGKMRLIRTKRLQDVPTVDAVEVVRCKDCKHYNHDTLWCVMNSNPHRESYPNWYADDFCSYGERRTDG